jgi:hypothetical protein
MLPSNGYMSHIINLRILVLYGQRQRSYGTCTFKTDGINNLMTILNILFQCHQFYLETKCILNVRISVFEYV